MSSPADGSTSLLQAGLHGLVGLQRVREGRERNGKGRGVRKGIFMLISIKHDNIIPIYIYVHTLLNSI